MKNYLLLFCLSSFLLTSCGDDDCVPGTFEENIVGTWKTPSLGDSEKGTVTFNADGTGVGSENGLFYAELNGQGSGNFEWSYNPALLSENLEISWDFNGGGIGVDMTVVDYKCDETTLNWIFDIKLERE